MQTKALMPVKAQPLDPDEESAFWEGKVPRRLLAIPFGGPIPHPRAPRGVDLDGEWFSERTDIFGPHRHLRQDRTRLVDFHHSALPPSARHGDPFGKMTGVFVGKAVLDDEPDEDGWWVDFWVKEGEKRVNLVKRIAKAGAQLFGSSQPKAPVKRDADTNEITQWPFWLETISTAPQNTLSVMRPAKAVLDDADTAGISLSDSLRALFSDVADLGNDLRLTSLGGDDAAKAGRELSRANEAEIEAMLEDYANAHEAVLKRAREFLDRIRSKYRKD